LKKLINNIKFGEKKKFTKQMNQKNTQSSSHYTKKSRQF